MRGAAPCGGCEARRHCHCPCAAAAAAAEDEDKEDNDAPTGKLLRVSAPRLLFLLFCGQPSRAPICRMGRIISGAGAPDNGGSLRVSRAATACLYMSAYVLTHTNTRFCPSRRRRRLTRKIASSASELRSRVGGRRPNHDGSGGGQAVRSRAQLIESDHQIGSQSAGAERWRRRRPNGRLSSSSSRSSAHASKPVARPKEMMAARCSTRVADRLAGIDLDLSFELLRRCPRRAAVNEPRIGQSTSYAIRVVDDSCHSDKMASPTRLPCDTVTRRSVGQPLWRAPTNRTDWRGGRLKGPGGSAASRACKTKQI